MSVRIQIVLAEVHDGFFKTRTGITARLYKYDGGQPNNRGELVGTLTENPAGSSQYYIDYSGANFRGVITIDDGMEVNLPAWEGKKFLGDTAGPNEIDTAAIQDGAVTPEKTDFLYE